MAGPGSEAAIHTEGLTKTYGSTPALADLSMTVPRGEIFGFLGPNGAGKTTAVKLLVGLSAPSAGRAWVLGRPAGDLQVRARFGYLPELFRYQAWLSAYEVLELHCALARVPAASRRPEIAQALVTVGLAERARDRVATFSKGMQQRLGLAVALVGAPELVFLDEPTSALDPVGRRDVRDIILGLRERGATVFLNSHLLSEVEQVCDRVAVVDRGRVIAGGAMADLLGEGVVHLRVEGDLGAAAAVAGGFGSAALAVDRLTVTGIDPARVPDLVAELVRRDVRIHSVERARRTLEDRFLELLEDR